MSPSRDLVGEAFRSFQLRLRPLRTESWRRDGVSFEEVLENSGNSQGLSPGHRRLALTIGVCAGINAFLIQSENAAADAWRLGTRGLGLRALVKDNVDLMRAKRLHHRIFLRLRQGGDADRPPRPQGRSGRLSIAQTASDTADGVDENLADPDRHSRTAIFSISANSDWPCRLELRCDQKTRLKPAIGHLPARRPIRWPRDRVVKQLDPPHPMIGR